MLPITYCCTVGSDQGTIWGMHEEMFTTFAEAARSYRHQAGLTQEELAHRVGVSRETIRKIEAGITKNPDRAILSGLERETGLSIDRAYRLIFLADGGEVDERVYALLVQIARVDSREQRRQIIARLPAEIQEAMRRIAQDALQEAVLQLTEVHQPATEHPV